MPARPRPTRFLLRPAATAGADVYSPEDGLRLRPRTSRPSADDPVLLVRMILQTADLLGRHTRRDRQLLEAYVEHGGNASAAARALRPRNPEALRVYLLRRIGRFRAAALRLATGSLLAEVVRLRHKPMKSHVRALHAEEDPRASHP